MRLQGICVPLDGVELFQRHVTNNGM